MKRFAVLALLLTAALVCVYGCSDGEDPTGSMGNHNPPPRGWGISIEPADGAVNVARDAAIVVTFSRNVMEEPMMMDSMEHMFRLHTDWGLSGAEIGGAFDWNSDYTVMTFQPTELLADSTTYTIHFEGMLMDMDSMMSCPDSMMMDMEGMMDSMMMDSMMMMCMGGMMGGGMMGDSSGHDYASVFSTGPQIMQ